MCFGFWLNKRVHFSHSMFCIKSTLACCELKDLGDLLRWITKLDVDCARAAWSSKREIVYALANDGPHDSIVDIGCGNASQLSQYFKGGKSIVGIDIDPKTVKEAKSMYKYIDFLCADARCIPFQDETFDLVIATEVIEHFEEGRPFVAEAFRICRKGGTMVLSTPNYLRWSSLFSRFIGLLKNDKHPHNPKSHVKEYSPYKLIKLLRSKGFHVDAVYFGSLNPYLFPFRGSQSSLRIQMYKSLNAILRKFVFFEILFKWDFIMKANRNFCENGRSIKLNVNYTQHRSSAKIRKGNKLNLEVRPPIVSRGESVTFSGQLIPPIPTTVFLGYTKQGLNEWKTVASLVTDPTGCYWWRVAIPLETAPNTYYFVSYCPSVRNRNAKLSSIESLTVV